MDYEGAIDLNKIRSAMDLGDYLDLPAPFRPKTDWGAAYTMQLLIAPGETENKKRIVKYYRFEQQEKTPDIKDKLCVGELLTISWGRTSDKSRPLKVFTYMVDRLGGTHFRYVLPPSEVKASETKKSARRKTRSAPSTNLLRTMHLGARSTVNKLCGSASS